MWQDDLRVSEISKHPRARTRHVAGKVVATSAAIVFSGLVTSCGWVDSAGQNGSDNMLLGLAQAEVAEQINVTAETPELVDLTVLAQSNGVSADSLQWRATGPGDVNSCAAIEDSRDISSSLEQACDQSVYQIATTGSTVSDTASEASTSAPEPCAVFIVERDSANASTALFEIHTPALTQPVALAYTIESITADGGIELAHDVNLCIEP